jgi:sRNA-binding regulator protein Hfq
MQNKKPGGKPFQKRPGGPGGPGGRKFQKGGYRPPIPQLTPEEKAMVNVLDDQAQDLVKRVNRAEAALPNRESEFLEENTDKPITILFRKGDELTGTLVDIDKYKIVVDVEGTKRVYYKQALTGYYIPE